MFQCPTCFALSKYFHSRIFEWVLTLYWTSIYVFATILIYSLIQFYSVLFYRIQLSLIGHCGKEIKKIIQEECRMWIVVVANDGSLKRAAAWSVLTLTLGCERNWICSTIAMKISFYVLPASYLCDGNTEQKSIHREFSNQWMTRNVWYLISIYHRSTVRFDVASAGYC